MGEAQVVPSSAITGSHAAAAAAAPDRSSDITTGSRTSQESSTARKVRWKHQTAEGSTCEKRRGLKQERLGGEQKKGGRVVAWLVTRAGVVAGVVAAVWLR